MIRYSQSRSKLSSGSRWLAACVLCVSPILSAGHASAAAGGGEQAASVEPVSDLATLIAELGDESFTTREKAMATLWQKGRPALASLRNAAAAGDPEVRARAEELILYISAGVLPDSPEEVKQLVMEFSTGDIEGKLVILRKLMELSQWRQVIHLANIEPLAESRARMAELVQISAGQAAREAIVAGDFQLAADVLELTGDNETNMGMRAWFYVRQGQLDQQLKLAAGMPGQKGALWRMSLHRANGNLKAAIKEADLAGLNLLANGMRIFTGNAMPWLDASGQNGQVSAILGLSYQLQQARLEGKTKEADLIARELVRMVNGDDSAPQAAICLAANGYRDEAIGLLTKHDVITAIDYYDSIESPERCLELLGIERDAKAPYSKWVAKNTDAAMDDDHDQEEYFERLLILTSFLYRHGEGEHCMAVMSPLMKALEEDGEDAWFELLPQMRVMDLGWLAVKFIQERGNEDNLMDVSVSKLLGSNKTVTEMWSAVKKRHPEDLNEALRELSLLAGIIADPNNETDAIHQALLAEAQDPQQNNGIAQNLRVESLYAFAVNRNDFKAALGIAEKLAGKNARWANAKTFLDSAMNRWAELEPVYAAEAEEKPGNYLNLAKWSLTLRKMGKKKQAAKLYDRALMLTMGDASALNQVAAELSSAGYDDEAVKMWEHAAIMASPGGTDFQSSILYLSIYGENLYLTKQWSKAAAISEVYSQLRMRGQSNDGVLLALRGRFNAEFGQGMALLEKGQRDRAIAKLDAARKLIPGDGSLADVFFPALREAGIDEHYNRWFNDSYEHVNAACKLYPESHNSQNTVAWLAARAVRRLDDALEHSKKALSVRPHQGAYLDTMAEVWFAKGDRQKAIEWSEKAVASSVSHAHGSPRTHTQVVLNFNQLSKQLDRFKTAPMPR
ncbi:hypothetical protein JIN77_04095 [Verrucomicrobiaceae bacterium R5-34]|nr:hypothetical protein [Verrucomicrobiaceae bacterium R5-34]